MLGNKSGGTNSAHLHRPMGVGQNTIYYDLEQFDALSGQVELADQYLVRETTIFVGNLPEERLIAGQVYRTLIADIDGSAVVCPQRTNQIMAELSARKLFSLRLCQWAANYLNIDQLPYFCGVNSFIPDCSQQRHQPSWIGTRWYNSMRTIEKATLVTFTQPDYQYKVVIRVNMSQFKIKKQLAFVREMIVALNHMLAADIRTDLNCSEFKSGTPANLPQLAGIHLPQVTCAQLFDFCQDNLINDACCIAEGNPEYSSVAQILNATKYAARPPRELICGRKALAAKKARQQRRAKRKK
jgi:hypothetical protein